MGIGGKSRTLKLSKPADQLAGFTNSPCLLKISFVPHSARSQIVDIEPLHTSRSIASSQAAESFLSNLQTEIFHSCGDPSTNTFASNSIGRIRQLQEQSNASHNEQNRGANQSAGGSLVFEFMVQPQEFTVLRHSFTQAKR
jgi:hypothetical protein